MRDSRPQDNNKFISRNGALPFNVRKQAIVGNHGWIVTAQCLSGIAVKFALRACWLRIVRRLIYICWTVLRVQFADELLSRITCYFGLCAINR